MDTQQQPRMTRRSSLLFTRKPSKTNRPWVMLKTSTIFDEDAYESSTSSVLATNPNIKNDYPETGLSTVIVAQPNATHSMDSHISSIMGSSASGNQFQSESLRLNQCDENFGHSRNRCNREAPKTCGNGGKKSSSNTAFSKRLDIDVELEKSPAGCTGKDNEETLSKAIIDKVLCGPKHMDIREIKKENYGDNEFGFNRKSGGCQSHDGSKHPAKNEECDKYGGSNATIHNTWEGKPARKLSLRHRLLLRTRGGRKSLLDVCSDVIRGVSPKTSRRDDSRKGLRNLACSPLSDGCLPGQMTETNSHSEKTVLFESEFTSTEEFIQPFYSLGSTDGSYLKAQRSSLLSSLTHGERSESLNEMQKGVSDGELTGLHFRKMTTSVASNVRHSVSTERTGQYPRLFKRLSRRTSVNSGGKDDECKTKASPKPQHAFQKLMSDTGTQSRRASGAVWKAGVYELKCDARTSINEMQTLLEREYSGIILSERYHEVRMRVPLTISSKTTLMNIVVASEIQGEGSRVTIRRTMGGALCIRNEDFDWFCFDVSRRILNALDISRPN